MSQADRVIANLKDKKIVDQKTLRDALEKQGTDLATKHFDKAAEQGAEKAFDVLMVGLAAAWRRYYNESRPHTSLGWMTPKEFASSAGVNSGR